MPIIVSGSYFLKSCVGCSDCLFCTNLTQKQYCIRNKQLSKENIRDNSQQQIFLKQKFSRASSMFSKTWKKQWKWNSFSGIKNENVSGDHINVSKNAIEVFDVIGAEDCRYCQSMHMSKNCMDFCYWGQDSSWIYEVHATGRGCSNLLFCNESWDSNKNLIYCDQCMFSSDLFGCCGIRHGKSLVFNKNYSQHEYEMLCGKIIDHMKSTGEWGEFLPLALSPFGYNETVAQDYFPITESKAISNWYKWKQDDEISSYHGEYYKPLLYRTIWWEKSRLRSSSENIDACVDGIIRNIAAENN